MAFSLEKREKIHNKYDGKCAYCGDPVLYKDMQIDKLYKKHKPKKEIKRRGYKKRRRR